MNVVQKYVTLEMLQKKGGVERWYSILFTDVYILENRVNEFKFLYRWFQTKT